MRVVVTGGGGFLGSHLCERLLADGCEVLAIDNFLTESPFNVEHLLEQVIPRPGLLVGGPVPRHYFHRPSSAS